MGRGATSQNRKRRKRARGSRTVTRPAGALGWIIWTCYPFVLVVWASLILRSGGLAIAGLCLLIPTMFAGWRLYAFGEVHWSLGAMFAVGIMIMSAHVYFPDPTSTLLALPLLMVDIHYILLGVGTFLFLFAGLVAAVLQGATGRHREVRSASARSLES